MSATGRVRGGGKVQEATVRTIAILVLGISIGVCIAVVLSVRAELQAEQGGPAPSATPAPSEGSEGEDDA